MPDDNVTEAMTPAKQEINSSPSPARREAAKKRLLLYVILFFATAIIIVLIAFAPQFLFQKDNAENKSQIETMILEAEGVKTRTEQLQNDLHSLREQNDNLTKLNAGMQEEIDALKAQAAENSQSLIHAQNVITTHEQAILRFEAKITAADNAILLIIADANGDSEKVSELKLFFEDPDMLELLDESVRSAVQTILDRN